MLGGTVVMKETKKRLLISLIPLLILAITLGSLACASEEASEGTPTPTATPQATPAVHEDNMGYAIEAFQRFPVEWQKGRFINLVTFREDSNLRSFYDDCRNLVGQNLSTIGIDLNEVDHVSFVIGHAAVYSGSLDLSNIEQVLEGMNYDTSTYLDIEIWESPDPEKGVVTLLPPNSVLVTKDRQEAELCITVIKGWGDSLYANDDIEDVIARLPQNSLRVDIYLGGDSGVLATASTIEKISSGILEMMRLVKFIDDANAENGFAKTTADFNSWARAWNMVSIENVQIRRYAESTGIANIEDIEKVDNPLGYQTYWLN
jgi:hypothetical protein